VITHHEPVQIDLVDEENKERQATVHGVLDVFTSSTVVKRVLAGLPDSTRALVIDLRDVSFVDSAGVSALVRLRQAATSRTIEVRAHLGDAQTRFNTTVVDLLRRVLPCDD
jgi:anti-anti-sigma factor